MKLAIYTTGPIRLQSRDVPGGELLATIETELSIAQLAMMLQLKQARAVPVDAPETPQPADAPEPTLSELLQAKGVQQRTIAMLYRDGVDSVAKARQYFAEHQSFTPIIGIGPSADSELRFALGL